MGLLLVSPPGKVIHPDGLSVKLGNSDAALASKRPSRP